MTRWSIADLADAAEAGLTAAARRFDLEQAPSGLDALEELEIHPLLAEAFRGAGYGVEREHRYPADRERRRETEGERCDLVLTPEGRDLRPPARKATLFDDPGAVDFEDAFWLEVKVVAQYTEEGANRNYASQLLSTVGRDVRKLSKDRGILHAGLLIILFVAEPIIADHDLGVWQDRCLERHLPIGAPSRRVVPVTDRLGNRLCVVALYPVSHY
jgi:hypothetical protein